MDALSLPPTIDLPFSTQWKSPKHFYDNYISTSTPVLFVNAAAGHALNWRAISAWRDHSYLVQSSEDCLVPIVFGGCEENQSGNEQRTKVTMSFHKFLTLLLLRNGNDEDEETSAASTTNTSTSSKSTSSSRGYLKQVDLETFPLLRKDVAPEDMFCPPLNRWWYWFPMFGTCNMWMGNSFSNKTGLHNDDEENVLCQIIGSKKVLLIAPSEKKHVYVNDLYDSGTECCDVNASSPDLQQHPLFAQVKQIYSVTLHPGDVLYIPKYWYHEVQPISISISINYFSSTWIQMIWSGTSRLFWDCLHRLGLYKRGRCVCHNNSSAAAAPVKLD